MTGYTPLLIHTAELYTSKHVNINGRVHTADVKIGDIRCRFVQPSPSTVAISGGAEDTISATVYAEVSTARMMRGHTLPLLIRTSDELWNGAYEVRKPPRVYESYATPHHIEFDVVRVNHDIA